MKRIVMLSKTAFLANMSHEIRTPLYAIIGLDRIALDDPGISLTANAFDEDVQRSMQAVPKGRLFAIMKAVQKHS